MWDDAVRIARHYRPEMLQELEHARGAVQASARQAGGGVEGKVQKAKMFERQARGPRNRFTSVLCHRCCRAGQCTADCSSSAQNRRVLTGHRAQHVACYNKIIKQNNRLSCRSCQQARERCVSALPPTCKQARPQQISSNRCLAQRTAHRLSQSSRHAAVAWPAHERAPRLCTCLPGIALGYTWLLCTRGAGHGS